MVGAEAALTETRKRMNDAGIAVSLFVAPDARQIEASARTGAQFIELHTGQYAEHFSLAASGQAAMEVELQRLIAAARAAHAAGLQVNAGHGINYSNISHLWALPYLAELNIGHSIVSRALFTGLEQAVRDMLTAMAAIAAYR